MNSIEWQNENRRLAGKRRRGVDSTADLIWDLLVSLDYNTQNEPVIALACEVIRLHGRILELELRHMPTAIGLGPRGRVAP